LRILDRYIAKKFLISLGFSLIAFILIFLLVDLIENLDKFIDRGVSGGIILSYYLNFIPFIMVLTLPVAMLLSTLFSLGALSRNFELTAMKANGISLYRILAPIYIIGLIVSALVFFVGDDLVSESNRRKSDIKREHIENRAPKQKVITTDVYVEGNNGALYYMKSYNSLTQVGSDILIQRILGNRVVEYVKAEKLKYSPEGWIAEHGTRRIFNADTVAVPNTFEEFDKMLLKEFKAPPEAFENLKAKPSDMPYHELKEYISLKQHLGKDVASEKVELNLKISFPLINFIILILGAPLAAHPRRSGVAIGFATSLIISFVYFTIIRACQSLGQNHHLSPVLAAWLGNIIFAFIGLILMVKAHK
jgi:lipopolysaccharide export system permease protein